MSRELAERCKGRWPDILRRLGVLSSAALAGKDVPCPMCGGHDLFRFSDKGFGRWFCRGCGQGGDGVRLIQAIKRIDFALAATMVESVVGKVSYASAASGASGASHTSTSGSASDAPKDPMKSWRNAGPFVRSSPVDIYLKGRGLELTDDEAGVLTFLASAVALGSKTRWPAMLARVALATGEDITTHQTFIEPDGSGKAEIEKPRLFAAGARSRRRGVVRPGSRARIHRRRRHREHTLGHAHVRRHSGMRGLVGGWRPQPVYRPKRAWCAFSPTTTSSARASPRRVTPRGAGAKGARSGRRCRRRSGRTQMMSGSLG